MKNSKRNRFFIYLQQYELALILVLSSFVSITAFFYAYKNGWTNLYGDGKAHLAIARKVVDMAEGSTLWERYIQLGSPWLPFQHILMLPFVQYDYLWRTGLAGSIVSLISFVLGAILLFRISSLFYRTENSTKFHQFAPYISLFLYLCNPPLLYLQTTPMTEPLFLTMLMASVYGLMLWQKQQQAFRLIIAGFCTALMTLTRYEGWSLLPSGLLVVILLSNKVSWRKFLDGIGWGIAASSGPIYWLWHNWAIYGKPSEFYSGMYSANGYFLRNRDSLSAASFAVHSFFYSVLVVIFTITICVGPITLIAGSFGVIKQIFSKVKEPLTLVGLLLFICPLFIVYSVFSGNIQIYPFFLNVRYGLSALPGLALFFPCVVLTKPKLHVIVISLLLIAGQFCYWIQNGFFQLSIFQEAYKAQFVEEIREQNLLAEYLRNNPPTGKVLMHTGSSAALVINSTLTYKQIIHEGTRQWHESHTKIPDGIDLIIYKENDELSKLLKNSPSGLEKFKLIWETGTSPLVLLKRERF